jgi:cell shape-determining protein MreC
MLVLTVAAALLPPAAVGWTRPPAELFGLLLTPFTWAGNRMAAWIRPAASVRAARFDGSQSEEIDYLRQRMVEFERLYLAEQDRVQSLQRQLEQLQKVPAEYVKTPVQPLVAHVAMRSPASPYGLVTLNKGSSHGVKPHTIAVYDGVHLVGRVTEDVDPVRCSLLPLANSQTPLMEARVLPKERPAKTDLTQAAQIQLHARGDGMFHAQADRLEPIREGDEVVLLDAHWPAAAQAMKIGVVHSIRPDDLQPLRNTILVRPAFQIPQLTVITLKIELEGPDQATASAASEDDREAQR